MSTFSNRCFNGQQLMAESGINWLFVPHSTDLKYLIGHSHRQSERLTLLLLPREGRATLVLPLFEMPQMEKHADFFDLVGWAETENPIEKVSNIVGSPGDGQTIAISNQFHSVFLLRIQKAIPKALYITGDSTVGHWRTIKDSSEIGILKEAAETTDLSLAALFNQNLHTMTELDVIRFLHEQLLANGHESVGTGIVGAGPNGASPHHKTSNRQLKNGDAVVVDFGGGMKGYHSDMTRTFHIGKPPQEFIKVYNTVRASQEKALEAIRPGMTAESIDRVCRDYINEKGYCQHFLHRTGHGIGLDGHENPYIVEGNKAVIEEGMTFSVEHGIYIKGHFGVRIEDIVAVTSNGVTPLNKFTHDLMVID